LEVIETNPISLWTWYFGISRNPNLTIEFVKKHCDKDLNWYFVSQSKSIHPQDVEDNPSMLWDWDGLSYNPNITIDFVKRHLRRPWNWFMLSCHSNITLDMVTAFPVTGACWAVNYGVGEAVIPATGPCWAIDGLSSNPNISLQTMLERPDIQWNWSNVAGNSSLTFEDFEYLCEHKEINPKEYTTGLNSFEGEKKAFTARKAREHMAAYHIQQCWFRTITNPYCDIGARSLLNSYNKLFSPENMCPDHLLEPSHCGMAS